MKYPIWELQTRPSSQLTKFHNPAFGTLRAFDIDGTPHFVARDAALMLGYANPTQAIIINCKQAVTVKESGLQTLHPQTKLIPEADLYRLIMRSKLPAAERFQDWVTEEVLPAIRKHGMYATAVTTEQMLADPDVMIQTLEAPRANCFQDRWPLSFPVR